MRLLIILALLLLAEYYSFVVVRSALRGLPPGWRTGLFVFYFILTGIAWACFIFFRVIDWAALPHLARNLIVATVMGIVVGKLLILLVMLLDEVRRLMLWLISLFYSGGHSATDQLNTTGQQGIPRSVFLKRFALLLGGLSLFGFAYGVSNRYHYRIRRVPLKNPKIPAAFQGLKIVQLSDIHAGSFDNPEAVAHGIELAMQENPDLILITGDLVNNKAAEIEPYKEIFSRLQAPLGVYSILGNHDYGDYEQWPSAAAKAQNLEDLKQHQADMGWKLLNNEHVLLQKDGATIALIGVENWSAKLHFPRHGDLAAASKGLEQRSDLFQILMSHDPSHWDAEVRPHFPHIDLTLSGHTHGMQFGVEIPGFKWSPVQYVYQKWAGLYEEGRQQLYVNRGMGFIGYPGRIGILPEITVIELGS